MEQITAMKITGLGLQNFRNHTEPQYFEFGDYSFVSGHNGSGKTTMAHGICYALYGVSYYGEQKIERLMNENACELQVQLDFIDQNGKAHSLVRSRKNDKNSLLMDGYTIRQGDVERIFCDRDVFLAMFNPTYLTERLTGNEGRELILKFLSPVEPQTVLEQIGTFADALAGIDLTTASPEQLLEDYRKAIRQAEKQLDAVRGNIDAVEEMIASAGKQLGDLYTERRNTESAIAALKDKQFDGLDPDELAIQRDALISQLAAGSGKEDPQIAELRAKIEQVRQRVYVSKYTQALAEAQAEAKMLSEKYAKLAQTYKALKPGVKCPACTTLVTEENLAQMQASMMAELTACVKRVRQLSDGAKRSRNWTKRAVRPLNSSGLMIWRSSRKNWRLCSRPLARSAPPPYKNDWMSWTTCSNTAVSARASTPS
jgi:DNA repair exonuclease SbcCD ATPase subunit